MNRALPASLLVHALFLTVLLLFGARVAQQPLPRQRAISVRLAELPGSRPQGQRAQSLPAATQPPRPAVLPKAAGQKPVPKQAAKPAAKTSAKPDPADRKSAGTAAAGSTTTGSTTTGGDAAGSGAAGAARAGLAGSSSRIGTDINVPPQYVYYLDLLEQRIARNWQPRRLGFRSGAPVVCSVHFQVEPDGSLTRATVAASSGVPLMDREALRAVESVGTFLPIPAGMAARGLGITYIFSLTAEN